jgi:hypothetical protein
MRNKVATTILAAAAVLTLVVSAYGQQAAPSGEPAIQQLRDAIKAMTENAPSAGSSLEAQHRGALRGLQEQLRDALLEKNGALKQSLRNLQPQSALPPVQAYLQQLTEEQQRVDGEIQSLKTVLAQTPAVAAAVATPDAEPTPAPLTREEAEAKASFGSAVKDFTPAKLREAALSPDTAEAAAAEVKCKLDGSSGDPAPSELEKQVCRLVQQAVSNKRITLGRNRISLLTILTAKLLRSQGDVSYAAFVTQAQERRTDQQVGASPGSSGTTSLVSKGGVPWALGFAVENGAAVQTQSDTTVTFRINPAGLFGLMNNQGFISGFQQSEKDPLLKFLRKSSVGLTFDTSRGDQAGVFTGDRQQLSEVTARFEFVNERDPRSKKYEKKWEKFVSEELNRLAAQVRTTSAVIQKGWGDGTQDPLFRDPALQAWLEQTNALLSGSHFEPGEVESIIRRQAELVPVNAVSEETVRGVSDFAKQFQHYSQKKQELLDEIAKGNVFTLEYTNKREVNAPDTSNFRFIVAKGMQSVGRTLDFTANGSLTLFHSRPAPANPGDPAPGRVRDFQFAGQVDVPFKVGNVGQFVLWFSGRYERLLEDASAPGGGAVAGTKGDIAVGQFGLKVPLPGTGLQLPLSFTFANRTELVKEKEVRGNFGFTLNFDSILSRFKPF